MGWSHQRKLGIALLFAGLWGIAALKPTESLSRPDAYFDSLQAALKSRKLDHPVAIIDLDRVDANLGEIRRVLGQDYKLRATAKSLPSYELLEYVLSATSSRRVMEFHGPFLRPLCERLSVSAPLDVLLGKPLPESELVSFLAQAPTLKQVTVHWLIDTPERLAAYAEVAEKNGVQLSIVFEIDVGLHRGGIREPEELLSLVKKALEDPSHLRVSGVLGYEGHVPHAPPLFRSTEAAQQAAFVDSMHSLQRFIDPLKQQFPALVNSQFLIDAGGSKTYPRYRTQEVKNPSAALVNELAIGSAILKPADFDVPMLDKHQPAIFIAEPVLKRISPAHLPFSDAVGALWRAWNPNRQDAVFVYGGGWDMQPAYPAGLFSNPLYNDRPADNRIPNQTLLNVGRHHPIKAGDYVFYRPLQSDVLMQFEEILVVRGGAIVTTWHPLPHRL